jgi:hypothetical protein
MAFELLESILINEEGHMGSAQVFALALCFGHPFLELQMSTGLPQLLLSGRVAVLLMTPSASEHMLI